MFRHTLVTLLLQNQEWALKNQWNRSWDCEAVLTPITAAGSVPENRNHWITRRPVYWLYFQETSILALFSEDQYIGSGDQYIGSVFRRPVLALFSGDQYFDSVFRRPVDWLCFQRPVYWLCFQETTLFSGDQYIDSVFRRPVYWLCFQETSTLALVFRRPVYWLCFQETR